MDRLFTGIVTAQQPPAGETLTLARMMEVMEEGQKQIEEMDDKLVESLLLGGFRVIINDAIPTDMVAVLPGRFKGSLKRALEKLKSGDPRDGVLIRNLA